MPMRNLQVRLRRLEQQAAASSDAWATCGCWQVISDDEPEQQTCPHGLRWAGTIRIVHVERGPAQS
jgi:hypothetical protein